MMLKTNLEFHTIRIEGASLFDLIKKHIFVCSLFFSMWLLFDPPSYNASLDAFEVNKWNENEMKNTVWQAK